MKISWHRAHPIMSLLRLAASAVAMLALVLAAIDDSDASAEPTIMLTGSGHAPSGGAFTQPAVSAMNMGATATTSAPGPTPAVARAVPAALPAG